MGAARTPPWRSVAPTVASADASVRMRVPFQAAGGGVRARATRRRPRRCRVGTQDATALSGLRALLASSRLWYCVAPTGPARRRSTMAAQRRKSSSGPVGVGTAERPLLRVFRLLAGQVHAAAAGSRADAAPAPRVIHGWRRAAGGRCVAARRRPARRRRARREPGCAGDRCALLNRSWQRAVSSDAETSRLPGCGRRSAAAVTTGCRASACPAGGHCAGPGRHCCFRCSSSAGLRAVVSCSLRVLPRFSSPVRSNRCAGNRHDRGRGEYARGAPFDCRRGRRRRQAHRAGGPHRVT